LTPCLLTVAQTHTHIDKERLHLDEENKAC
jgi:hypothetical protein